MAHPTSSVAVVLEQAAKKQRGKLIIYAKSLQDREKKQVLLEYSCVGVNPQLPKKALCPFLLSWALQLPPCRAEQPCRAAHHLHRDIKQLCSKEGLEDSSVTSDGNCLPYSSTPREFIWPQNKQDGNSESAEAGKASQTLPSGTKKTTALLHFRYTISSMILLFNPAASIYVM